LPTLNKIETEVKCSECGQAFQDNIWFRPDGSQVGTYKKCFACREKERQLNKEQELQVKLKETIQDQLLKWDDECSMPAGFSCKTFKDFDAKLQPKAFQVVKNLKWKWQDGEGINGKDVPPKSLV